MQSSSIFISQYYNRSIQQSAYLTTSFDPTKPCLCIAEGLESRTGSPLTTGSNWLNPSTSIAFMLDDSLTNALFLHALQNNYVALARSSQWENANTGVERVIVAELESLRRQRRLECGLISQIHDANSTTCNIYSTVISC